MSSTSITNTQNTSDSQEKSPARFIPHNVTIDYYDIGSADLTHGEFRAYCAILGYGRAHGHLSMNRKNFLKDNPVFEERQFRRYCEGLEEKGYVYKIQYSFHRRGSMSYVIPKPYYNLFISYILKKYKRADWAAEVKVFFEGGNETDFCKAYQSQISQNAKIIKKRAPCYRLERSKMTAPLTAVKNVRPINNINIIKEEENSERGESPPLFKASGKEKITPALIKKELLKLGLDWKKGCRLYSCCKKEFDAYDNPIAGLVAALKGGYADEKINKSEEKLAKEKTANDESEKKAKRRKMGDYIAKAIQRDLNRRKENKYTVCVYERNTQISERGTNTCANFIYDERDTIDRLLQFAQKNEIKIDLTKEKRNEEDGKGI